MYYVYIYSHYTIKKYAITINTAYDWTIIDVWVPRYIYIYIYVYIYIYQLWYWCMNRQYQRIFQKLCGSTLKCCHHVTSFLGRRHGLPMVTPCRRMAARSWSPILVASPPANSPDWQLLGQDLINHGTLSLGIWGIENMVMIVVNHLHPTGSRVVCWLWSAVVDHAEVTKHR